MLIVTPVLMAFRISAIQKLKANHNAIYNAILKSKGVPNISYSEIESKSQRAEYGMLYVIGVPNISYSEIESKSQQECAYCLDAGWCSEYQLFRN